MWIKLTSIQQLDVDGKSKTYHPGDWINVGKQAAMAMLLANQATVPDELKAITDLGDDVGIILTGGDPTATGLLGMVKFAGTYDPAGGLKWHKTLMWDLSATLRRDLIPVGFKFLDRWDVAVPVADYGLLACHIGDAAEQRMTLKIIRDLRVPVYDPRVLFVRDSDAGQCLVDTWITQQIRGKDTRLAFIRALYIVQPLLLALPTTWQMTGKLPVGSRVILAGDVK